VGGHFIAEMVELRADFAATSARSLPRIRVGICWEKWIRIFGRESI